VTPAERARARAEELLAAHLTPAQRAEWAERARITIVKRGVIWSILLRDLAMALPLAGLLAMAGWRLEAFLLAAVIAVALSPFWLRRFVVASARRREWVISARASPIVRVRGRTTRFCAVFRENLPAADRVLAWKQVLELSEGHFLRKANVRG
jgi:hypothetical protein